MRLQSIWKPSYSYRDNKKIDEKSRTIVLLFLFFCQMSTFDNLLKMPKMLNVDNLNVCERKTDIVHICSKIRTRKTCFSVYNKNTAYSTKMHKNENDNRCLIGKML